MEKSMEKSMEEIYGEIYERKLRKLKKKSMEEMCHAENICRNC